MKTSSKHSGSAATDWFTKAFATFHRLRTVLTVAWARCFWCFAGAALFCADASAQAQVFSCNAILSHGNKTPIPTPSGGPAIRYPSSIHIAGTPGRIDRVLVTLAGLSNSNPWALDILVVGPGGQSVLLMSDAGTVGLASPSVTLTFDDFAGGSLPEDVIDSGAYRPTDYDLTPDTFNNPAPTGPYAHSLSAFNGISPNGTWSLYVMDQGSGTGGSILGGWSLTIVYESLESAAIPANGSATRYPWNINVSGLTGSIAKLTVNLDGLSHSRPDDLDVLLVGPRGQSVVLMSDAGGAGALSAVLGFDDSAAMAVPDESLPVSGTYRPSNYNGGDSDVFSAPAPAPPYGNALSVFNGTDPNGGWSLYIQDDQEFMSGSICGWSLGISTEVVPTALSFDGVDDVVLIGGNSLPVPWTAEFWVNRQDSPAHSSVLLVDDTTALTALKLEQYRFTRQVGFTQFGVADYSFNYIAPVGAWVHLAFVGSSSNTQLYVNGVLQDAIAATIALPLAQLGSDNRGDRLKGTIDEVRVWNVARSQSEIQATMGRPLTGSESNLAAYWRFDEAGGTTANDSSGHGRTATLNGPAWVASTSPISYPLFINEWLALNVSSLTDNFGERDPWIELFNTGISAINLAGFSLTDDWNNKTKYVLPGNTIVPANSRLLIWADGQPAQSTASQPHADFRLTSGSGVLALFSHTGALVDSLAFGPQSSDRSQGRCPDGSTLIQTLSMPTPAAPNSCSITNPLPLVITQPPVSQTVAVGSTVRFTAVASGPEPLSYQWIWNGMVLTGQTNSTLVLANVQATNSGLYSVAVFGGGEMLVSPAANLLVPVGLNYLFSDTLGGGDLMEIPAGAAETNNILATAQTGEPDHAGQPGGKSMWLSWFSFNAGIVTFSTHGSDFDTLLAAYTGNSVSNLTLVAASDDSDGLLTSTIRYGVQAGTLYQIAIDGYYGATGHIELSWSFVETSFAMPVILNTPTNRSVLQGESTTFSVIASNALHYQWFFNSSPIPGANSSTYNIANIQPTNVGHYVARVSGVLSNVALVETTPAVLEIGHFSGRVSHDKPRAVCLATVPTNGLRPAGVGFDSLSAGVPYQQVTDNTGSTAPVADTVCGYPAIHSRFFDLPVTPEISGLTMLVNAMLTNANGTPVPALVEVHHNEGLAVPRDGCTTDLGQEIRFIARPNECGYNVKFDGKNGAVGKIYIHYGLGTTSRFSLQPMSMVATSGIPMTLSAGATGIPSPVLRWQMSNNGSDFSYTAATGSNYSFTPTSTAYYRVEASNFIATVMSATALVTVLMPPMITNQPANLTKSLGERATFAVRADGTAPLSYQWFKGTNPISGATSDTYTLNEVRCADAGIYTVRISNSVGAVISNPAQLCLICPPPPTLSIQTVGANLVLLWNDPNNCYSLQMTRALASPPTAIAWSNLSSNSPVPMPRPTSGNQFFRLICRCP